MLTDYGRSLSADLMSTWSRKGLENPLFGALKNLETVKIGGDIRGIQTKRENKDVDQGKLFLMQENLELAVRLERLWFVGTAGTQEGPAKTPGKGEFLSERHYLLFDADENVRIRVGKFRLNVGFQDPNHTRFVNSRFGFGSNSETYALEATRFFELGEVIFSAPVGDITESSNLDSEKGLAFTASHYGQGKAKYGFSALLGDSTVQRRSLWVGFGIMPLAKDASLRFQVTGQEAHLAATPKDLAVQSGTYTQLSYMPIKGLTNYVFIESFKSETADIMAPGIGTQWIPIPHVNLQVDYRREFDAEKPDDPSDFAWFLLHLWI